MQDRHHHPLACVASFLLLVLLGLGSKAGAELTPTQQQDIQLVMKEIQRCTNSDAMSFTLLDLAKSSLYERGMGTDANNKHIGPDHVFCIGDATQGFSAVLLAMLIDANETVSWDMPVERIIGKSIPLPDLYRTHHLTLKDIFAMRSGLSGMDIVPQAQPYDQRTLISKLRFSPVSAGFREQFIHNDVLFALVQEATEVLGGDSWFNLMRRYVLIPLGMDDTVFTGKTMAGLRSGKHLVKGAVKLSNRRHNLDMHTYDGLEMVAPAASMCTTSRDMYKWFRFLLQGGKADNQKRLIREDALKMLYQGTQSRGNDGNPVNEGFSQPGIQASYIRNMNALGFITGSYKGFEFVSQDGSIPGYQTLATISPDAQVAVFVSMLGDERPRNFIAKVLMNIVGLDVMLVGTSWVREEAVCALIDNMESKLHAHTDDPYRGRGRSARPLKDYEATFKNWAFGDVMVKYNASGEESLTLKYGKVTYKLEPTPSNDTFHMMATDSSMWYSTNADWYRENKKLYAVFGARPIRPSSDDEDINDEEENTDADDNEDNEEGGEEQHLKHSDRIVNVTISGFDSSSDPVFAINARRPAYEMERRDVECAAPARLMNVAQCLAVLLLAVLTSATAYIR